MEDLEVGFRFGIKWSVYRVDQIDAELFLTVEDSLDSLRLGVYRDPRMVEYEEAQSGSERDDPIGNWLLIRIPLSLDSECRQ